MRRILVRAFLLLFFLRSSWSSMNVVSHSCVPLINSPRYDFMQLIFFDYLFANCTFPSFFSCLISALLGTSESFDFTGNRLPETSLCLELLLSAISAAVVFHPFMLSILVGSSLPTSLDCVSLAIQLVTFTAHCITTLLFLFPFSVISVI